MISTYAVRPSSYGIGVDLEHIRVDSRIMQQPQRVIPHIDVAVKEVLIQPHPHGNGAQHIHMHRLALLKERHHIRPEPGHGPLLLRRPLVRKRGLVVPANLVALLEVRRRAALLADVVRRVVLRHLLPPGRRVAPVGLGRRPQNLLLGRVGLGEELGRLGKGVLDRLEGDGVVLEVDEAGILEAAEDGLGGVLALLGRAIEEFGEVDEL